MLEQQVHDAAASIIDPETGKHAEVFVRRRSPTELTLRTHGSPAFVRELEKRLGVETGSIETMSGSLICAVGVSAVPCRQ
jgi:hypothetical protein